MSIFQTMHVKKAFGLKALFYPTALKVMFFKNHVFASLGKNDTTHYTVYTPRTHYNRMVFYDKHLNMSRLNKNIIPWHNYSI